MLERMGTRVSQCLISFLLGIFLCAGSTVTETPLIGATRHTKELVHKKLSSSTSESTERDVITPITTVPAVNPTPTIIPTPIPATTPVTNPVTSPETPTITTPSTTPITGIPASSGGSWCVSSQSASETALQVALDYACGYGGADCSGIQSSGPCYSPDTVRDHASYAFNDYYQKNPVPNSCNFGGAAVITNIDPSNGSCTYPATSTSASVLNTTNPTGSTVYGAQPGGSTNSEACVSCNFLKLFTMTSLLISFLAVRWI